LLLWKTAVIKPRRCKMATLARETVVERGAEGKAICRWPVAGLPEKGPARPRYMIEVDTEKCIGCRMCMIDCAAHNAAPEDLPVAYPKSWALLPEAALFADVVLPMGRKGTVAHKCEACLEALEAGIEPVCLQICPTGALTAKPVEAGRKELLTLVS
jgi:Fe-S-cluster-containing dehydrogenase component